MKKIRTEESFVVRRATVSGSRVRVTYIDKEDM
jgi:hypothetical protein